MDGIMRFGQLPADLHELGGDQPQAAAFEAADDLTDQAALDPVRFDEHECSFQRDLQFAK